MIKVLISLLLLICVVHSASAEIIKGSACYRFSDNESVNEARDIALSMAKREALERYSVFVSSTSNVENMVLKNDLISSLTAGVLKNLNIIKKIEDIENKKICREITAEVEPVEIKQRIVTKINVYKQKHSNFQSGLPQNDYLKVLKVVNQKVSKYRKGEGYIGGLKITAKCTKRRGKHLMRLVYYDKDGIPLGMFKDIVFCNDVGDILVYNLNYKTPDYSFEIVY